MNNLTLLI